MFQVGVEKRGERAGAAHAERGLGDGPDPAGREPTGDRGRCTVRRRDKTTPPHRARATLLRDETRITGAVAARLCRRDSQVVASVLLCGDVEDCGQCSRRCPRNCGNPFRPCEDSGHVEAPTPWRVVCLLTTAVNSHEEGVWLEGMTRSLCPPGAIRHCLMSIRGVNASLLAFRAKVASLRRPDRECCVRFGDASFDIRTSVVVSTGFGD